MRLFVLSAVNAPIPTLGMRDFTWHAIRKPDGPPLARTADRERALNAPAPSATPLNHSIGMPPLLSDNTLSSNRTVSTDSVVTTVPSVNEMVVMPVPMSVEIVASKKL